MFLIKEMRWTWEQYCDAPDWLVDGILAFWEAEGDKYNKEREDSNRAAKKASKR